MDATIIVTFTSEQLEEVIRLILQEVKETKKLLENNCYGLHIIDEVKNRLSRLESIKRELSKAKKA